MSINNHRLENIRKSALRFLRNISVWETDERQCFYIATFRHELRCTIKGARFLSLFVLSVRKDATDSDQPWASALNYPQETPASLCGLYRAPMESTFLDTRNTCSGAIQVFLILKLSLL